MKENIKEEIEKLRKIINQANFLYHTLDKPEISDYEYDMYLSRLVKLEEENPEFKTNDSPTNKVGGEVLSGFLKVEHEKPMMSLSNVFTLGEILKFINDIKEKVSNSDFIFEEKLDGLAISIIYKNGEFFRAITRGDGLVGEDVSNNVKTIKTIPLSLSKNINITVRGEIFMPYKSFEKTNIERKNEGLELFANPRNATAGTIRQLDSKVVARRNLDSFIYTIVDYDKFNIKTQVEVLNFLTELGFNTNKNYKMLSKSKSIDEIISYFSECKKENKFQTDGIVIKLDNLKEGEKLGYTAKYPKSQTAYKFPPVMKLTKLKDIIMQVGRLGVVTPVADLEPVLLEGSVISKATLHNFSYIKEKDIRIGDYVYIFKAGEIIPKVFGVEIKKRENNLSKFVEPSNCPKCNTLLEKEEDGIISYCPNSNCPSKKIGYFTYFCSRPVMNIEGLSDKQISILIDNNLLTDVKSLYNLENMSDKIKQIRGFADKKLSNIFNSIKKSKERPFSKLFASFGIKNVGLKTSEIITSNLKNIDNIINASISTLTNIYEIGEEIARSIYEFFKSDKNLELVKFYKENGFNLEYNNLKSEKLKNYIFAITGTFQNYKRDDIKDDIIKYGGEYSSSISKKTTHLICGDSPGSKLEKAKENNIKIITEKEYEELKNE